MAICYKCGSEFPQNIVVTRSLECSACSAPVRCCKNCFFYEPGVHWDCRETIPEAVLDKERSNFCDYFRLNSKNTGSTGNTGTGGGSGRDSFDALFS